LFFGELGQHTFYITTEKRYKTIDK